MTLEKYFKITTTPRSNNNANNGAIKQEYICKEEVDLDWQEEWCDDLLDHESMNVSVNSSKDHTKAIFNVPENDFPSKEQTDLVENLRTGKHGKENVLYNAIVVIQKLPKQIVKKYLNKQTINVKCSNPVVDKNRTANLCARFCENCNKTVNCNLKITTCCPKCKKALLYECRMCKQHLMSYTGLLYHLRTSCQSQGYYYQCPGCPYKSVLKIRIKEHMKKLHMNLSISDMKIIATKDLQNDVKSSEIHVHKCSKCGKQFRQLHFLNNHLKACGDFKYRIGFTEENEDSKDTSIPAVPPPDTISVINMAVLYCKKCDKRVALNDSVYGPKRCNSCKSLLIFECTKCEKQYRSSKGIIYHMKTKCAAQEMYFCSKCNYQSSIKMLLSLHYKTVHDYVSVECPKCKNVFKNKGSLMKHLSYCGKEAFLHCSKCPYKSNNKTNLRVHLKRHYYSDKKIEATCPKCGKKLKNQFSLKCHLNYCGKEKGFLCTLCTYKSSYKKGLREHMIRMHFKDVNRYPACPKCDAKFPYKHCANAHLRFCGTSKPHCQCDHCPFRCGIKREMKRHIIQMHLKNIDNSDDSDIDVGN